MKLNTRAVQINDPISSDYDLIKTKPNITLRCVSIIFTFSLEYRDLDLLANYLLFLDLGPMSFTYENKNLLFSKTTKPFSTKFCM